MMNVFNFIFQDENKDISDLNKYVNDAARNILDRKRVKKISNHFLDPKQGYNSHHFDSDLNKLQFEINEIYGVY